MTGSEGGAPIPQNPATTRPAVDSTEVSSGTRQPGYGEEFLAQHQRRHDAALRCPPLGSCGCVRDPAHDRHRCDDPLGERQLNVWLATIDHLACRDLHAIVPANVRRALRDRGAA